MTPCDLSANPGDVPAFYEIRVRGVLDQAWCDLAEGMTLEVVRDGPQPVMVVRRTFLRPMVQDQAALAGLLEALLGANAVVFSVMAVEAA